MALRPPSLERLRALQAVCRNGGFSAAAQELLLTQSAVSTRIRLLEQETSVQLVERIGKSARPTPAGEILLACAGRVFDDLEASLGAIAGLSGDLAGRLVIGAGGTATTYLLPDPLAAFSAHYPRVEVKIVTGNTPDLAAALVAAEIDLVVATAPLGDARLDHARFFDDRLVCIAPAAAAPTLKRVRPADLAGRRVFLYERGSLIREVVDGWLGGDAAAAEIQEIGSAEAQKTFVRAGAGWSIISEIAVADEVRRGLLRVIPLAPALARHLVVAWRRDRAQNPAIAAARRVLLDGTPRR